MFKQSFQTCLGTCSQILEIVLTSLGSRLSHGSDNGRWQRAAAVGAIENGEATTLAMNMGEKWKLWEALTVLSWGAKPG